MTIQIQELLMCAAVFLAIGLTGVFFALKERREARAKAAVMNAQILDYRAGRVPSKDVILGDVVYEEATGFQMIRLHKPGEIGAFIAEKAPGLER